MSRWHIRTVDTYVGSASRLRDARTWCMRVADDSRRRVHLEHVASGAYFYHGPRRGRRGQFFMAYIYRTEQAHVFGFDLTPPLPWSEDSIR